MSDAATRVHHPYSPSKLQSLEACPKYQSTNTASAASLAGTKQHDAVEAKADTLELDDHQALAVAQCVAYSDETAAKYPGGTIIKEEYLPIDDEVVHAFNRSENRVDEFKGTTAGYLDFAVVSADGTVAEIIDYKFGQHAVEPAENNLQGIAYMLGIRKRFPKLATCTVQFVMPHRDEIDIHTFDLTGGNAEQFHIRIRTVVGRAVEAAWDPADFSTARPNIGACLFCALVGKCPKVAELAINIGQKFAPLQVPATVTPALISDPKEVSLGIKVAQVVEAWAKSYRAAATNKAVTDPDFIPEGYKLISMTRRTVESAMELAKIGKEFLPEDKRPEVDKLFDIPIGGVEDLIRLTAPRGQKDARVEEFGARALEAGALKEGEPFAVLRQSTKKISG